MVLGLVLLGISLSLWGQEPPPNTGKLSWNLWTEATAARSARAAGEEVQEATVLLYTTDPVTEEELHRLEAEGYVVEGALGRLVLVRATLDLFVDDEHGIDRMEFISSATLPLPSIAHEATNFPVRTDGTPVIQAPALWEQGFRGSGTKIAIIDLGYDLDNPVLRGLNPRYYLIVPGGVSVGTYRALEGEVGAIADHGTACALIVADVAPEAELYLLSYPERTGWQGWLFALEFAVRELQVDVVCSAVSPATPTCHADGTGEIHSRIDEILRGTDSLLCVAAGNWAQGSGSDRWYYGGVFRDDDGNFYADFTPDSTDTEDRNTLAFRGRAGDQVLVILEWDDWASDVKSYDLNLFVHHAGFWGNPRGQVGISLTTQFQGTTRPTEAIWMILPFTGSYVISIEDAAARWHGQPVRPVSFNLYVYNVSGAFPYVEHHSSCGSLREVATSANPQVIVVGAVSVDGLTIRPYSSRGPTADGRAKPDVYCPDGVTGAVYPHFYGTSAAAPYAAGAVSLIRSANPTLSPAEVRELLQQNTVVMTDGCENPICVLDLRLAIQALAE